MSRRLRFAVVFAVAALGCNSSPNQRPKEQNRPVVLATTPMLADLAREVGGSFVDVQTLLTEGLDPHTYQPTGADIRRLSGADLVLCNGLLLEGAMQPDLEKLEKKGALLFAGSAIPADKLRTPPDFEGHPDPHVWMDPILWAATVPAILGRLQKLLPDRSDEFAKNAERLTSRLNALDRYAADVIETIPPESRLVVTAHDAFGYFGAAYGLEVSAVQGVSTESAAGLADVQRLVDLIVDRKVPAVFFESSVSNRNVAAVLQGAKAKGADVIEGGSLYSDSAGPAGTWEGTYFGMIEHNVNTLAAGLGGVVPTGGFRAFESRRDPAREAGPATTSGAPSGAVP